MPAVLKKWSGKVAQMICHISIHLLGSLREQKLHFQCRLGYWGPYLILHLQKEEMIRNQKSSIILCHHPAMESE